MSALRFRRLWPAFLVALLLAPAPAHALLQDLPQPINTMCPVMPDEEVVPKYWSEYQGRTVGFCCRKCLGRFEREPEAYLVNLPDVFGDAPAAAVADMADTDPVPADDEEHEEHEEHGALMGLFARSHVLVLHFPIALLIAGALAELLARARRNAALTATAHFCANLALPFAAWTFFSGLELEEEAKVGPMLHEMLERHELFGKITAGVVALVFILGWRARKPDATVAAQTLWRLTLFASAILVGITAHAGGQLVHGLGYPFD
ncbi:MAG: YHS domain-containing protein [Planctomycetota bacterium]|jgi:uncharacterized membrane protein/YHS domain-containing protein